MATLTQEKQAVIIKFAGDSGDGMQLTGGLFTDDTAISGSDLATFPDFPAEIRAPIGTLAGVSGFQLHFGSERIYTPGDRYDVLVAMNAAALKSNISNVRKGGTIIINEDGFDSKNLRLAKYDEDKNPLDDNTLEGFETIKIPVTKLTREAISESTLGTKEKDRCKNMFVLGFLLWRYSRSMDTTTKFLNAKFKNKPDILDANQKALMAGYNLADTMEVVQDRYVVKPAKLAPGKYRSIMGNDALVMGLVTASKKLGLSLFYGSYPITPASSILHSLSKYKNFGVRTFQAEDEIAAVSSAIGASYGGSLGITGTSGPGLALKGEAMGLAVMLELPLVVIDVQRGGPSTGLPTKTEQSDLLQALYGRNGECPMPVIASSTPSDCFEVAMEACRIAVQHMTPVVLLSDGYIANGAEPWRFPKASDIPEMKVSFAKQNENGEPFMPYQRDEKLARQWAIPGTPGLLHRVGGIEKEDVTGNISYDPANHEHMVKTRERKVEMIADYIPEQKIESGHESGSLLLLGWGSTYGVCEAVTNSLTKMGYSVGHAHLRYLRPFPRNLEELMKRFDKIVIPEINNGQLVKVIRDKYLLPAIPYNKIQGTPIAHEELFDFVLNLLK
ncbi:MAG: 2-oxoacid:acceptor oxidoreductase subunit alpha [Saprospiraceae bacterium]|nr:2-oxoacid:acceptor oxidoreductase subunit alpha [Saprospiraceae bacterium]MCF8249444.1 2-oxoacid:acceptor oxidoreductase subunit alpha [Saprospiraceae bacterium]MCF8279098.1 2-oxoacid:acceptor oxidoreductase subunit alpha [Bacteroidales bacterium]MCF8311573.1 2-oxoacid:acceptor oxidoreductase subunit alpha [Saprospiraceae bacterium]MCF8440063.1 2-oxoacid:acceptor oxidoreductase subunit alpha [Saprospiraceae bacterium]